MNISKLVLIVGVAFNATSCDFKETGSLLSNANSNEISFECSNRNWENTNVQNWEIVIDLNLGTGNYSRSVTEGINEIKTIARILVTPEWVDGYDRKDSQVFSISRDELVVAIYEDDSIANNAECKIVDKKYNRKF